MIPDFRFFVSRRISIKMIKMSIPDEAAIARELSVTFFSTAELDGLAPEEILEAVARRLVERYQARSLEGFDTVFSYIEQRIIWSTPDLRQWLIVNFLEVLKNVSAWSDLDYAVFEQWLGPESHVAWRWLEKRWQGSQSLADTLKYGSKKNSD
jgi:hypothetical protein